MNAPAGKEKTPGQGKKVPSLARVWSSKSAKKGQDEPRIEGFLPSIRAPRSWAISPPSWQ
jgi:hypothetical protein